MDVLILSMPMPKFDSREDRARASLNMARTEFEIQEIAETIGVTRQTLSPFLKGGPPSEDLLRNAENFAKSRGYWIWDDPSTVDIVSRIDDVGPLNATLLSGLSRKLHGVAEIIGDDDNPIKYRSEEFVSFWKMAGLAIRSHISSSKKGQEH